MPKSKPLYHLDVNHNAIKQALRAAGYIVVNLAQIGDGRPDMLVIDITTGRCLLLEIKTLENMSGEKIKNEVEFMISLVPDVYRIVDTPERAASIAFDALRKEK